MSCPYTGNNQTQKAICDCLKSSQELSGSIQSYQDTLISNATATSNYNNNDGTYKANKSAWDTNRQNVKNGLLGERQNQGGCGLCPNAWNTGCNGGWDHDSTHNCGFGNGGCERTCKRSDSQAEQDLGGWLSQNPQPQAPTQPVLVNPTPPTATIQCCGISIGNLTTTSLSLDNISQQCNSSGSSGSSAGSSGSSSGSSGSSSGSGSVSGNKKYMITGVICLIISVILSFVLLIVIGSDE